jgi:hypothetical protein
MGIQSVASRHIFGTSFVNLIIGFFAILNENRTFNMILDDKLTFNKFIGNLN